jgi:CMP-N,N'-diacetyllegionaminic acid synthase
MIHNKKILAVTLARGGSKAIPKKNIVPINGIPLIGYTITEAKKSRYIDEYIVSTDCSEIQEIVTNLGADAPFLRPDILSDDTASSADALLHTVSYLQTLGRDYDYIVELMATNPLKTVEDIDSMIELAVNNDETSCVAVHQLIEHHPSRIKYIENGYLKPFYDEVPESRRQDLKPKAYIRSGSIYVTKVSFLQQHRARYSTHNTLAYILPEARVANLDEPNDLKLLQAKMS